MAIWFRQNNGNWNNSGTANPTTNTGGYPLTGLQSAMIPFGIADNNGITFNFGASSFAHTVPSGFVSGWPNASNTGFTSLDPATVQGDASVSGSGNLTVGAGPSDGSAYGLADDAQIQGSFYFEGTIDGGDIFSAALGLGVCIPGAVLAYLLAGEFNGTNPNGGAIVTTADFLLSDPGQVWISGTDENSDIFTFANGDVICIAVTLEPFILPGVSGTGAAGTIGINVSNGAAMGISSLNCIEHVAIAPNHYVSLRTSDDAGASWDNARQRSMGAVGQYLTDISWQRCGIARDKIIEISWSSPQKTSLTGAFIRFTIADT